MQPSKKAVILYVDDDDDEHFIMQTALADRDDLDLRCYFNRDELFAGLSELHPDIALVMLDLNMPGSNGVDIALDLRNHPNYNNIPLAVITNGSNSPQAETLSAVGVQVHSKPSTMPEIDALVSRLFQG